jgi:4-oxalocrotonate tautomerase
MPFAQVCMIEGRSTEQKQAVIEKVTKALVEATGSPIANGPTISALRYAKDLLLR